jgi:peptide/nickel transport system ATP-binding protein
VSAAAVLAVEDLHLRFATVDGVSHVLDGVSFEVGRGERVALVGESGCGKSATVRAILGLHDPRRAVATGRISLAGRPLLGLDEAAMAALRGDRIALIVQDPIAALNPMFTVGDQLAAIIRKKRLASARAAVDRLAAEALTAVAIPDPRRLLAAYPHQISGGQAQRVIIAAALLGKPQLILADEPGTALDVTVQAQTLRLMEDLAEQSATAVLLITHNLGVVREFASRVYVMYAGQIVESGAVASVFAAPAHPYTRALFKAVPRLGVAAQPTPIEGTVPQLVDPPPGCRFSTRCPHVLPRCSDPAPRIDLGRRHVVACWLQDGDRGGAGVAA